MKPSSPSSAELRHVRLARWALLAFVLGAWELSAHVLEPGVIVGIPTIARRIIDLVLSGVLFRDIAVTGLEALAGVIAGTIGGVTAAIILWRWPRLDAAFGPYLMGAMSVPKLALAPLAIVWLGIGVPSKLAFVTTVVFFLILFGTLAGIRSITPTLITTARVLGARRWTLVRDVLLPGARPFVIASLKVATPHAVSAAVMGELVASDAGLGHAIQRAAAEADTAGMLAIVVVVTALVVGLDTILNRLRD
jgi:NitT/TauT family transport system permease protein